LGGLYAGAPVNIGCAFNPEWKGMSLHDIESDFCRALEMGWVELYSDIWKKNEDLKPFFCGRHKDKVITNESWLSNLELLLDMEISDESSKILIEFLFYDDKKRGDYLSWGINPVQDSHGNALHSLERDCTDDFNNLLDKVLMHPVFKSSQEFTEYYVTSIRFLETIEYFFEDFDQAAYENFQKALLKARLQTLDKEHKVARKPKRENEKNDHIEQITKKLISEVSNPGKQSCVGFFAIPLQQIIKQNDPNQHNSSSPAVQLESVFFMEQESYPFEKK